MPGKDDHRRPGVQLRDFHTAVLSVVQAEPVLPRLTPVQVRGRGCGCVRSLGVEPQCHLSQQNLQVVQLALLRHQPRVQALSVRNHTHTLRVVRFAPRDDVRKVRQVAAHGNVVPIQVGYGIVDVAGDKHREKPKVTSFGAGADL